MDTTVFVIESLKKKGLIDPNDLDDELQREILYSYPSGIPISIREELLSAESKYEALLAIPSYVSYTSEYKKANEKKNKILEVGAVCPKCGKKTLFSDSGFTSRADEAERYVKRCVNCGV